MKNVFLISLVVLGLSFTSCGEDATKKIKTENLEVAKERDSEIKMGGPRFKFDKTEHDFGTINEGDVVETVFSFTNVGK